MGLFGVASGWASLGLGFARLAGLAFWWLACCLAGSLSWLSWLALASGSCLLCCLGCPPFCWGSLGPLLCLPAFPSLLVPFGRWVAALFAFPPLCPRAVACLLACPPAWLSFVVSRLGLCALGVGFLGSGLVFVRSFVFLFCPVACWVGCCAVGRASGAFSVLRSPCSFACWCWPAPLLLACESAACFCARSRHWGVRF